MSQADNIKIPCTKHQGNFISHGCSSVESTQDMLFCSECLLENLDYCHEYRHYIHPLPKFFSEFSHNIQTIRQYLRPYEEVYLTQGQHMTFYSKFVTQQKQAIVQELKAVQEQFQFMLEKIKIAAFSELENCENQLDDHYGTLDTIFNTSEISHLQYDNSEDIIQKLVDMRKNQCAPFLVDIRSCIQGLKDGPVNSQTIRNLQKTTQQIQAFKRQQNDAQINLSQVCNKNFKQLYSEMENRLNGYLGEAVYPLNQTQNAKNDQNVELNETIKFNKNQGPKYLKNCRVPVGLIQEGFNNGNATGLQSIISNNNDFKRQKNVLVKLNGSQGLERQIDLQYEACFESDTNCQALCVVSLSENQLAVGSKDSVLRIFKMQRNQFTDVLELELSAQFQSLSEDDQWPCTSVAKLSPQHELFYRENAFPSGLFYLASGQENGQISIWKYDVNNGRQGDQKAFMVLKNHQFTQPITCILDIEGGSNYLVCGDANGSIIFWDYLSNKLSQQFSLHNGQINSLCLYNNDNNFAAGSYDGCISLWAVMREGGECSISCVKLINNQSQIYSITSLPTRRGILKYHFKGSPLIITDSQKKVKILNTQNFIFINETQVGLSNEPFQDVLTIEILGDISKIPYLLCFTKSQMMVLGGEDLKLLEHFDHRYFQTTNLGLTQNSSHKVVFMPSDNANNNESGLYFAAIDQNPNSRNILSVYKQIFQ